MHYNVLGNLVKITQGDQQRYFKYDSLSRLIRERQVEQSVNSSYNLTDSLTGNSSWTRKFEYNSHGLLTHGYDARGIQTDLYYDDLNRVTLIDYSDSTSDARYYYDSQTLPSGAPSYTHGSANGRLIAMTYGSSSSTTGTYFGYDTMGRVNVQKQVTGSNTYSLSYTYNLAGLLATETYPSSRVLTHSYDNAGRLSQISDGTTAFASSFGYAPSGGMLSETWGNGAVHSVAYNNALQVSQIKLKQSSSGSELQRYDYLYGQVTQSNGSVDKSKNNGQIGRIDGIINGSSTKEWEQRFSYDELGRLSTAAEYQQGTGSTPSWKQEFTYDRYGNRFQSGVGNTVVDFTPVVSSDISVSTNRFISSGSTPMTYDASGNVTQDVKFRFMNYGYDANGRQVSASATNSDLSQTSVYDCAGQRVQTTSLGATHTMVYDIFGQQVADYNGATLEKENIYRGGQLLAVYAAASTCYLTIANFVTAFYQGALHRNPDSDELTLWSAALTKAQAQGNGRLIKVAQDLGTAVFTSSQYTNTDHGTYVNDLYAAFLQRTADSGGYAYWMAALSGGTSFTQVRIGFAYSLEFQNNVVRLCPGTSSSTSTSANLKYVLTDLQGSTRAVMDTSASILSRHDYLPFGEEIFAGVGLRTTAQKYSVTNKVRQRFAMTERDDATGLDHTWFRKYDSFAGRWTTPDPLGGGIANPQSLNRYTYAANDPINLVDPLGLDPSDHEPGHSEPDGPCPPGSPCSVDIYPGPSPLLGGTAGPEVFIPREPPSEGPGVGPPTGGDPSPQPPGTDPLTPEFLRNLIKCLHDLYGVTFTSIQAAGPNKLGIFEGSGFDRHKGLSGTIMIIANPSSFSSNQLRDMNNDYARRYPERNHPFAGPKQKVLGVAFSDGMAGIVTVSPYTNYLANDAPPGFDSAYWYLRRQVHELGHSLSELTGKGNGERGNQLENCVYRKFSI